MQVLQTDNSIVLTGVASFHPAHIFDCGQAFRWNPDGKGYTGIVGDKVIRVVCENDSVILEGASYEDYESLWRHYLDLDRDYETIKQEFSKDPVLAEAVSYGWGMRILNQDPWETLISFIISANNNITRIKGIVERLSASLGRAVPFEDKAYYTFPDPSALAGADDNTLKRCGCGYRGPYIRETARMVADGKLSLADLKQLPYAEARKHLLSCKGVGEKVADCILLFSMNHTEAFPVDVWIKRIMEQLYTHKPLSVKEIRAYAGVRFGKYAGLAQQYLFYYARDMRIGRQEEE
ncbi:MAG TPA: DNA glycosylase [Candidatus Atribacteria bacterium]|nr:DNA glycosylase [Candidatus Atribacteria bacterium]